MTGHELHHPSITDLIQPAVNFTLFAGLMVYVLRAPVREYFRERTGKIRAALDAGGKAKREAEALRAQLERDAAELPALRARLVTEMRETAERERELMMQKAHETAERIRVDARVTAEQEATAARSALHESIVQEAIKEAAVLVRTVITPADQTRFVDEFVQSARSL
jgi:F-type H+-transporting ATPase subunit b